jgi:hypothetical protein
MFHIPRVWHPFPVTPLEVMCGWTDDFGDDERSFPGGGELMHAIGLLDAPVDEVANVERGFPSIEIVVVSELLVVTGLPHNGSKPPLFKAIEVNSTCFLGFSQLIKLDAWSSKGDING